MRVMKAELEKSKNLKISENNVTIKSALNDESIGQIKALADEICQCYKGMTGEGSCEIPQEKRSKGFVCDICGYIYEGDTLPEDFVCPICKVGADKFSPVE